MSDPEAKLKCASEKSPVSCGLKEKILRLNKHNFCQGKRETETAVSPPVVTEVITP